MVVFLSSPLAKGGLQGGLSRLARTSPDPSLIRRGEKKSSDLRRNGTRTRIRLIVVGVLAVSLPVLPVRADALEDFEKLETKMETAFDAYVDALAAHDRHNAEGEHDTAKPPKPGEKPKDPRLAVLKKMDALAQSTLTKPSGAGIAIQTFVWSAMFDMDPENLFTRFERVAKYHANDNGIADVVAMVPDVYSTSAKPADWADGLDRIARSTKSTELKSSALFATGLLHMNSDKLPLAKKAFQRVVELKTDDESVRLANGFVFEIGHLQLGMTAPDFTAKTLDGKDITLKSLRGKVVLLDFWAMWCPGCLVETPTLKAAAERFADEPFVILAVSLDDFREMLVSGLEQKHLPGIQTWDESGRENPVAELYNAQFLPTWYLIDAKGFIRARDTFGEELIPAITKALAGW